MLIDPDLDNSLVGSWAVSDQDDGTPGRENIASPLPGPLAIAENEAIVRWNNVVSNAWYRLDYTPKLVPPDWQPAGPATQAIDSWIELSDTQGIDAGQRFFRLTRLFP